MTNDHARPQHGSPPSAVGRRAVLGGMAATAGLALLGAPATAATPAAAPAHPPRAGARTPFTTIGAETGRLGGNARVRDLAPGATVGKAATLELEASGYALVELRDEGDSVTVTNTTGIRANTLVLRASIPDAPTGGGITATLNLYVDGTFRQSLTLSSAQAWIYRDPVTTAKSKDPRTGWPPLHFYNEFPFWVEGAPIAPGSTVTLRKDADSTADAYHLDCLDLEAVAGPRRRPADALSVVDYGADPDFGVDSTVAIQAAVDDARAQGRPVWIPPGTYKINSLAPTPLDLTGVTVRGAGMWHSTIYRAVPLPTPAKWRSKVVVGSGTVLTDLQIDSNAVFKPLEGGGADYSINAEGAEGWLVERVWTRHGEANWLSGSHATIQDCRTADSYGDGFNVNNSNESNPNKRGADITVRNNFARGTGDDGFAVYSDAGTAGTSPQVTGVRIVHNTAVAVWWANGIRVAGGSDLEVAHNLVDSVSSNNAMEIGIYGDTGNPLESVHVHHNVLVGGGGWNGARGGVQIGSPGPGSLFPDARSTVTMTDNVLRGSLGPGVVVDRHRHHLTLRGNAIEGPAGDGVTVRSEVAGDARITRNRLDGLRAGQVAVRNDSPETFAVVQAHNSWQG
ncbi:glycosyl hydrolase family 28-related protein [Isoptericola sp. NPDC057559]|uniref:glycosyl hydrolase family 28-related protein n=1 Tax=Isoptericola sp. NPDC057559 TaxID=3346168 RepID=UPI0036BF8F9D